MNTKRKGSEGERELARLLTEAGYSAHRNEQRYTGGLGNPDVSADGLGQFHIECKRQENLGLPAAMRQAQRDAAGKVPVVMHRRNREPWLCTMLLTDWLHLMDECVKNENVFGFERGDT